MDINFFYCERNNLELLAEPLNLFTNILFLFFSILLYFDKTVKNKIFAFILFGIGIGSMLYHSFATRFTALVDILFIILFIFYYLVILYNKLYIKKNYTYILSLIFISSCYVFGYFFYESILGSSAFYFPILLHLILLLFYFIYTKKYFYFKKFIFIPIIFSISLYVRTVDLKYCITFSIGTHFFWHILNSIVLYLLIKFIHLIPDRTSPEKPT
ncbi:MAG: hypothetical protein CMJ06_02745 [Pelagibacterales bacterium]|mgnify:CR=1 FL=1|nr:hypothetical protein [Pelagibacterales bacterium]OUU62968.1 MAG: hypothetical protein CBC22_02725 [Alphaproteobacteria bacterium TMED62]